MHLDASLNSVAANPQMHSVTVEDALREDEKEPAVVH